MGTLEEAASLRLVDANLNRCVEGLRTLEDCARFILNDAVGARGFKELRHRVTEAAKIWSRDALLAHRDVAGDVGVTIKTDSELARHGINEIIAAASARAQQSLRTLSEFAKPIDERAAIELESIRYVCYGLCAALEGGGERRRRLAAASLYLLADVSAPPAELAERFARWIEAGVDIIQLRDKSADDRRLYEAARAVAPVVRRAGGLLIVNDRADIAIAADADGVHVGQNELPIAAARRLMGPTRCVGVSTHDLEQVQGAIQGGADYIGCGPTFPSGTKSFSRFTGVPFLRSVVQQATIPWFAIGGIERSNLDELVDAGVERVAVCGAIARAADPIAAIRMFKEKLRGTRVGVT